MTKLTRQQILDHAGAVFDSVLNNPKSDCARIIFGAEDNCSGSGRGEPYRPVDSEDLMDRAVKNSAKRVRNAAEALDLIEKDE